MKSEKAFEALIERAAKLLDHYNEKMDSCHTKEEKEKMEKEAKRKLRFLHIVKKLP